MIQQLPYQPYRPLQAQVPAWMLQQQQQGQGQQAPANPLSSFLSGYAAYKGMGLAGSGATAAAPSVIPGLASGTPVASAINGGTLTAGGEVLPMSPGFGEIPATDITNFAGSATPYIGAGGVMAGGYNAYQGIRKGNPLQAGLGGAGAGLGLNAMGYALGPWGWAGMVAAPALGAAIKKFTDKDQWKTEQKKVNKLRKAGINVPTSEADSLRGGRSKQQLVDIEKAKIAAGKYGNVEFAGSRNEKFFKPEDTWGAAANYELFKNDYLNKASEAQRRAYNQKMIDEGQFAEGKGSISIKDKDRAQQIWNEVLGIKAPAAPTSQPQDPKISQGPATFTKPLPQWRSR